VLQKYLPSQFECVHFSIREIAACDTFYCTYANRKEQGFRITCMSATLALRHFTPLKVYALSYKAYQPYIACTKKKIARSNERSKIFSTQIDMSEVNYLM
jgi:hypothetical protein